MHGKEKLEDICLRALEMDASIRVMSCCFVAVACCSVLTASGATCVAADVAARAGFLAGAAGPERLDRWGMPARFVALDGRIAVNDAWAGMVGVSLCI